MRASLDSLTHDSSSLVGTRDSMPPASRRAPKAALKKHACRVISALSRAADHVNVAVARKIAKTHPELANWDLGCTRHTLYGERGPRFRRA